MERVKGWTIFTLRGVPVRVHVSLLFLLMYILLIAPFQLTFVAGLLGIDPADLALTPFTWALVFALSLAASVLVHEFSHVAVARARGARVKRVTLMMLGGASEMESMPEGPADEFKVAAIGPVVSLAIGAVLLLISRGTESLDLRFFAFWIGQLNVALGIFNLLPAFPMDGGRMLRALLSARQGRLRGTRNAVAVSRVFSWIFGLVGLLQFNVLLILIAFFVHSAASSELLLLVGETVLRGTKARGAMRGGPLLPPAATLSEAAETMWSSRSSILAVSSGPPFGVVTGDVLRAVPRERWPFVTVGEAKLETESVGPDDALDAKLVSRLAASPGALPVVDGGTAIGLLHLADVFEMIRLGEVLEEPASGPTAARWRSLGAH